MTERPASRWNQSDGWEPPTVPDLPARSPLHPETKKNKMGFKGWAFLAFVGFILFSIVSANLPGSDNDAPSTDDNQYAAFMACTDFVEDRLKAPGTASFRNYFDDDGEVRVTGSGSGPYTVVSTVDSENGFGANIRSLFTCTLTHQGETWTLKDIYIN